MRKRLFIMFVNWIAVVLCYNGLTLNSVNLGGNIYVNMALGVLIEVPSYLFCCLTVDKYDEFFHLYSFAHEFLLSRFGRRPILLLTHFLCLSACLAALLVPSDWDPSVVVALSTIAKFGTTAAFAVVLLVVRKN